MSAHATVFDLSSAYKSTQTSPSVYIGCCRDPRIRFGLPQDPNSNFDKATSLHELTHKPHAVTPACHHPPLLSCERRCYDQLASKVAIILLIQTPKYSTLNNIDPRWSRLSPGVDSWNYPQSFAFKYTQKRCSRLPSSQYPAPNSQANVQT